MISYDNRQLYKTLDALDIIENYIDAEQPQEIDLYEIHNIIQQIRYDIWQTIVANTN